MNKLFDAAALAREDLNTLIPYDAPYYPDVIKMDANENPYDFPPWVMAELFERMSGRDFSRYPDASSEKLRQALAAYTGVSAKNIITGNGSDEIILNIMLTFGAGAKLAVATPTFSMYGVHGRIAFTQTIEVPRRPDFSLDIDSLKRVSNEADVKIVIVCSPNNPTGTATPPGEIEEILKSTRAIVVVDEAYGEFGGESCIPLLGRYPNLVILRTFSKAYSLAGLRVGYLLADEPIVNQLLKVKQPYNLNTFSQVAATLVMENLDPFRERIIRILVERDRLFASMSALPGLEVVPTEANFILFRTPHPAEMIYQGLLERGILIRSLDGPALPRYLRVSVGTGDENRYFVESLSELLSI